MKRFHAHVRVNDLEASVSFYSRLFGTEPSVLKPDYAKWMPDDPVYGDDIAPRSPAAVTPDEDPGCATAPSSNSACRSGSKAE